ncbi:hypothetical protein QEN19_002565 [Hanseniaspora menglaensis]
MKLPDFDHKLDRETSYYIRIASARWLMAYTFCVILLYIYLPKVSVSFALHKPSTNNREQLKRKRNLLSINNIVLVIAVLSGFLYNSFVSYIKTLDLVLITKRLGRNCMSFYVPLLFLTMRPSPLPNVLYLNLIPIHKWLGRLLVLQALIHTILYTCLYYKTGVLWKLTKLANVYGIISMIGFIVIAGLSISTIRRSDYRVFYISHYILTWMTVLMLQYHARPRATYYTCANIVILISQIIYRLYLTREIVFDDVEELSPTFKRVRIPTALLARKPISPGSHLRINNKHDNFIKNIFFNLLVPLQHPYTIESLPSDEQCSLIIKNGRFPIVKGKHYYVTGSFEPRLPFFNNSIFSKKCRSFQDNKLPKGLSSLFGNKDKKVIIVTGGSAVSFGLPILQILNAENYKCKMYWITRDLTDLNLITKNYQNLEIFVTKTASKEEEDIIIDSNSFNRGIDLEHNDYVDDSEPLLIDSHRLDNDSQIKPTSVLFPVKSAGTFSDKNVPSVLYKNYGQFGETVDEVDFTKTSTAEIKHKRSQLLTGNNFREPSTLIDLNGDQFISSNKQNYQGSSPKNYGSINIDSSSNFVSLTTNASKITIPKGLKVNIGRPTLGFKELLWLFNSTDSNGTECGNNLSDGNCLENIYLQTLGVKGNNYKDGSYDDTNEVLVIAAGPLGLVESTKNWAVLHNFQFYEEAFFL